MRTPHESPTETRQLYLVLRLEDAPAWTIRFSAGIERFIGVYPRLEGFVCGEPLLVFREIDAA
jgi:hypothetical protein